MSPICMAAYRTVSHVSMEFETLMLTIFVGMYAVFFRQAHPTRLLPVGQD